MNIVIITQDDPFYLADNIDYLVKSLPSHSKVVAAIVLDVSPFGKKESFLEKAKRTWSIFGADFFLHYSIHFFKNKLNPNKSVKKIIKRHSIKLLQLVGSINKKDNLETIRNLEPDLLVSIAGNQIFKKPLISIPPKRCINLHTALLPKYRGLMPSFWVLKNNELKTGVSVFFVDEGIDSGPIIVQREVTIDDMSQEQLIRKTKKIGMDCILEAIEKIHGGNFELIDNDANQSSYYSFPTKEDVIAFKKLGKRFF